MNHHLQTAYNHIRRAPYQAMSAILIMSLTFFVATILAVLAYGSWSTLKYFETRPQVIAFLKSEATPEEVSSLQRELEGDVRIKDVKYVSKEKALDIYKNATSDNPLLSELVSPKVFPASLEFSVGELADAEGIIRSIEAKTAVSQVAFTASLGSSKNIGDVINNLKKITGYIRIGGGVIISFLLASSLLILLVILGMRISSRKDEIEILQLIGASPGFIRAPFLFEGLSYSIFGAFIGWLSAFLLTLYIMPSVASYFKDVPVLPSETIKLMELFGVIYAAEFIISILLGTTGSLIAIRRYLKA